MIKTYEITFITRENPDDKLFKTVLENAGGRILNASSIGEHQFVYPIKKETRGVYTTILFELEPEKLSDLNRKMSLNEEILRFLIVAKKASALKAMAEAATRKPAVIEINAPKPARQASLGVAGGEIIAPVEIAKPKEITPPATPERSDGGQAKPAKKVKPIKTAKPKKVEKPQPPQEPEMSEEDRLKELDKKLDELLKD